MPVPCQIIDLLLMSSEGIPFDHFATMGWLHPTREDSIRTSELP